MLSSKAESPEGDLNSQSGTSPFVKHLYLTFREQKADLVFLDTEGDGFGTNLSILLASGYSSRLRNKKNFSSSSS